MEPSKSLIPDSFVTQLKEMSNIVSVVSRYVPLKKAGRNFLGLCPFHQEKTPSFTVNEEKQIFHCFGCGLGGDVLGFIMQYHHLPFPEAIRELAGIQGLTLPEAPVSREEREADRRKKALLQVHRLAAEFYRQVLQRDREGRRGRDYLKSRSLDEAIAAEFGLGMAPEGWDRLTQALLQKQVTVDLLEQSGLAVKKERGGLYDRFRNRLMFPILDERQQVVAFGGRALGEDSPKYLNSPESPLFSKGRMLYGLPQALPAIRRSREVLIVEGYIDLLSLYRHGFKQTVATLGTALGPLQVRRLKGLAEEVILVYDGDEAGRQAALRTVPIFQQEGVSARMVLLPPECDPDTYVNREGAERFADQIRQAVPMWSFYFEQHLAGTPGDIQSRVKRLEKLIPTLQGLPSEVERAYYIRMIAERLGLSETAVSREVRQKKGRSGDPLRRYQALGRETVRGLEWSLLEALLRIPEAPSRLQSYDLPSLFSHPQAQRIFSLLWQVVEEKGAVDVSWIVERLEDPDLRQRVTALAVQEFASEGDRELFLQDVVRHLDLRELRRREQALQRAILSLEEKGVTPELRELLEKKQRLMQQRRTLIVLPKQ